MTDDLIYVIEYQAPGNDEWSILDGEEQFAFTSLERASEEAVALYEDEVRAVEEFDEGESPGMFRVSAYKRHVA